MFSRQRSKSNKEQRSLFFKCLPRRLTCTVQCIEAPLSVTCSPPGLPGHLSSCRGHGGAAQLHGDIPEQICQTMSMSMSMYIRSSETFSVTHIDRDKRTGFQVRLGRLGGQNRRLNQEVEFQIPGANFTSVRSLQFFELSCKDSLLKQTTRVAGIDFLISSGGKAPLWNRSRLFAHDPDLLRQTRLEGTSLHGECSVCDFDFPMLLPPSTSAIWCSSSRYFAFQAHHISSSPKWVRPKSQSIKSLSFLAAEIADFSTSTNIALEDPSK